MIQCSSKLETEYLSENPYPFPGHCFDSDFTNSPNVERTWMNVQRFCQQITLGIRNQIFKLMKI
jgi:hypothetical protein